MSNCSLSGDIKSCKEIVFLLSPNRMASTSKKHRDFAGEPMWTKDITAVAGIGEALGKHLKEKGFNKAYSLLGQFPVLDKDEERFKDWLKGICEANAKQQEDCVKCLCAWCNAFL